jgi:hypothetical protein
MTDPHPRSRQDAYEAAVLETNQALMPERINKAVTAIHARSDARDQIEDSELRPLAEAEVGLHALKPSEQTTRCSQWVDYDWGPAHARPRAANRERR